jgi:hypothetical protein
VKRHAAERRFSDPPGDTAGPGRQGPGDAGRCARSCHLWRPACARREGVPGQRHGQEAGRRLEGRRAGAGLGWVGGRAASG